MYIYVYMCVCIYIFLLVVEGHICILLGQLENQVSFGGRVAKILDHDR